MAVAPGSLRQRFYYSPFKGNDNKAIWLNFKGGEGFDQFGREQAAGPEPRGGSGVWEHRVIGLCSSAPGILPRHGLVSRGGKSGTYRICLDNLRIRHSDGSTSSIWSSGADTRTKKIADTELFKHLKIRTIDVAAFGK